MMLLETIVTFFTDPAHLSVLIISWAFALISILYWNEHPKARYLYAHLFFLMVPLLDFAIAVPCQTPFFQGLLTFCSITYTRLVIYTLPVALLFAFVAGSVVAPALYKRFYRAKPLRDERYKKLADDAGIRGVRFWVLDTAKPLAFSFGRNVLISVGMFEHLRRKEQDAVLLHELGHVRQKSSLSKFSTALARFFSPVAHFASLGARINAEEQAADAFAGQMQGTTTHVKAAKRKLNAFARL